MQIIHNLSQYEILTDSGFQDFDGFVESIKQTVFVRTDRSSIRCTEDHQFKLKTNKWIDCKQLRPGMKLKSIHGTERIVYVGLTGMNESVYDPLNVRNGSSYISNSLISHNCLYLDELSFVQRGIVEEFWTSTYPTVSSGKESKIIISTTPNGYDFFYKLWTESEQGINEFRRIKFDYHDHPDRDEKWQQTQIKNLGIDKFNQEFGAEFLGASATLISGSKLNKLKPIQSTELIPNKLYQYFSPIKDHSYVMLVDTSRGKGLDYSAFVIVDISEFPYQVVCVFRDNTISTLVYPEIINRLAIQYNEAFVLIETNDLGQQVADTLRYDLEYENVYMSTQEEIREGGNPKYSPGCRTTKKTKSIGCNMLKDLIENSKLLVNDIEIITELSSFIRVGASYRADDGKHDDLVMCLVMFAYLTTQSVFKNLFDFNLRQQFFAEQLQDLDDQMLPLGFVSRGDDDWLNPTTSTTNGIAYQENKDQWFNF